MNNVYDQVRFFYEKEISWEPIIQRSWVEGYLRQKAWQGISDNELSQICHFILLLERYLANAGISNFNNIACQEYSAAIEWLYDNIGGFKKTIKYLKQFFSVLLGFYQYLLSKRIISSTEELQNAADYIVGGKRIKLMKPIPEVNSKLMANEESIGEESQQKIAETIEKILFNLGEYYQQPKFGDDFQRALSLFRGPMTSTVEEDEDEQSEFWLSFWDYFLFDYHLLANDKTPIMQYYEALSDKYTVEERAFLNELIKTQFAVFYVSGIVNTEWIKCTNLFTDENFYLPFPDLEFNKIRKLLFLGHILSDSMVLINYITSIEISPKLRRRIKEEIARQKEIFLVQQPNATWKDFFQRHALTVRHTVDILTNYNKVNVTPFDQLERKYPHIEKKVVPDNKVTQLLSVVMRQFGFSIHDISLAQKLWVDYCQLSQCTVRKPQIWAATVIYTFSYLNLYSGLPAGTIAEFFNISKSSIYYNRNKLSDTLNLNKYDPRYLTEEGFMFSLFRA